MPEPTTNLQRMVHAIESLPECENPLAVEVRCEACGSLDVIECFTAEEIAEHPVSEWGCMACGAIALHEV